MLSASNQAWMGPIFDSTGVKYLTGRHIRRWPSLSVVNH
jgi:hypothetical protein